MSEIRISTQIISEVENYLFNESVSYDGNELIRVYQGTMPTTVTQSIIDNRSDDVLIEFSSFTWSAGSISTNYTDALRSGVATWFSVYRNTLGQIVGTVGTTNESDLILGNTTISSGLKYRVSGLGFDFPHTIVY